MEQRYLLLVFIFLVGACSPTPTQPVMPTETQKPVQSPTATYTPQVPATYTPQVTATYTPQVQDFTEPIPLSPNAVGTYKGLSLALVENGFPIVIPVDDTIGVVCIGMSNAKSECADFVARQKELLEMGEVNPQVRFVNCAVGGHAIERWNDPEYDRVLWDACIQEKIPAAGLRSDQIRVVWHKAADMHTRTKSENGGVYPPYPDPNADYFQFYENLTIFATRLHEKLPAVQAIFVSSRSYGGFSTKQGHGEPLSYEEGLALNEWLRANPSVDGVWYGWGPYIWAPDCDTGLTNANDVCYIRNDYREDGVHPATGALNKISHMLHEHFLQYDWYRP